MVDMVLHMYLALIHDYSCYAHALQLNMTLLQHTKLMQTQFKTIQDYSRLLHNSRQFKTIQDSHTIQDNSRLFKTYTQFKTYHSCNLCSTSVLQSVEPVLFLPLCVTTASPHAIWLAGKGPVRPCALPGLRLDERGEEPPSFFSSALR
jgi:hypothetical protein